MINPYSGVNWSNCQHVPSCSHLHTPSKSRADIMKAYDRGLRHLAISNYYPSKPLYPLNSLFSDLPSDMISSPNAEHVRIVGQNLHLSGLGSLWESGTPEPNRTGVEDTWQFAVTNILDNLQHANGGGVVINHPKWSGISVKTLKAMLDFDSRVLGVELYNSDCALKYANATGWSIDQWDEVLTTGRRAWGFCVQDWDNNATVARLGCNVLLVDELDEAKCLEAYRNGNFYGRLQISSDLEFSNISYNSENKTLTVNTQNSDWIAIIYGAKGKTYREQRDNTTEYTYTVPDDATYIRVEAGKLGEKTHTVVDDYYPDCCDVIFSNPIMLTDTIIDNDKKRQDTLLWF